MSLTIFHCIASSAIALLAIPSLRHLPRAARLSRMQTFICNAEPPSGEVGDPDDPTVDFANGVLKSLAGRIGIPLLGKHPRFVLLTVFSVG
jgi:hypothetical protein